MPKPLPLDPASLPSDLMERIKARVQEEGDCWNWTGTYGNKVPVIGFTREEVPHHRPRKNNRYVYVAVRRALFALLRTPGANRQASGRLMVASCGNPSCVNPDHIRAMTRADMARLMGQRVNLESRSHKIALARRANSAKLTAEQAAFIRASACPAVEIAQQFGVGASLVHRIRRGEAWRDYSDPIAQMARSLAR